MTHTNSRSKKYSSSCSQLTEATFQKCFLEKVFRKNAANSQENTNFIEITLRHECSPVNLLHILRTPFPKNTSRGLLLNFFSEVLLLKIFNIDRKTLVLESLFNKIPGLQAFSESVKMQVSNVSLTKLGICCQAWFSFNHF